VIQELGFCAGGGFLRDVGHRLLHLWPPPQQTRIFDPAALVDIAIALERIDSSMMMPRTCESNETDILVVEMFVTLRTRRSM
jgi:hypothetical protein